VQKGGGIHELNPFYKEESARASDQDEKRLGETEKKLRETFCFRAKGESRRPAPQNQKKKRGCAKEEEKRKLHRKTLKKKTD